MTLAKTTTRGARALLTPRWLITTLMVIAAVAGMVRLGIWQLDRLAERRAFNARVSAQVGAPELSLNGALAHGEVTGPQLMEMEYRPAVVTGTYDPQNEIILRNQVYESRPGYHLLTPLRVEGTDQAVIVDRGFIPLEESSPAARAKYAQAGSVTVRGVIRQPHVPRFFGVPDPTLAPGETRLDAWNAINVARLQEQVGYPLLPVYLLASPDPELTGGPLASLDTPDLSEGPHMGYAIQWFTFAALLAAGYPYFFWRQTTAKTRDAIQREKKSYD